MTDLTSERLDELERLWTKLANAFSDPARPRAFEELALIAMAKRTKAAEARSERRDRERMAELEHERDAWRAERDRLEAILYLNPPTDHELQLVNEKHDAIDRAKAAERERDIAMEAVNAAGGGRFWRVYNDVLEERDALHKLLLAAYANIEALRDPDEGCYWCDGETPSVPDYRPSEIPHWPDCLGEKIRKRLQIDVAIPGDLAEHGGEA